jgi:hypothetical protein
MQVVGHIINGNHFLLFAGDNPRDLLLQLIVVFYPDEILPAFNGKYDVNVNLRVGVRHAQMMSLLTELGNLFVGFLQRRQPYGLYI